MRRRKTATANEEPDRAPLIPIDGLGLSSVESEDRSWFDGDVSLVGVSGQSHTS